MKIPRRLPRNTPYWEEMTDEDRAAAARFTSFQRNAKWSPSSLRAMTPHYVDSPRLLALPPRKARKHAMAVAGAKNIERALFGSYSAFQENQKRVLYSTLRQRRIDAEKRREDDIPAEHELPEGFTPERSIRKHMANLQIEDARLMKKRRAEIITKRAKEAS